MINQNSLQTIAAQSLNEHFGKPLYGSYCFSGIPQTVIQLLIGQGEPGLPPSTLNGLPPHPHKVILLFLDAFGWRFFEQFCERYSFLKRFEMDGVCSKLTSQFPSTTAAHVTTIHTGLPVGQSGVHEWFYYEPLVDRVIAPLLFSFAGNQMPGTLAEAGYNASDIFPFPTVYETLAAAGVHSYVVQDRSFTPSPYSNAVMRGAHILPYKTLSEGLILLTEALAADPGPAYGFLYYDGIDSIAHIHGLDSAHFQAEVDTSLNALERILFKALLGPLKDTLLLVTADHGQVSISPKTTIYLNQLEPKIHELLRQNRNGELLVPAGSPRDMFLYIREGALDEAQALLVRRLAGRAEVHRVQSLIEHGFFGPVSERFRERVADLVVLPYEHDSVWWYEKGKHEQRFYGHHGGLARPEMETLLLALAR